MAIIKSELETTEIELKAMATEAKIGFIRSPKNGYNAPMATGISIILYPKAQKRFIFTPFRSDRNGLIALSEAWCVEVWEKAFSTDSFIK